MKRKKVLSLVLAGTMMLSLAACSGGAGGDGDSGDDSGYDQVTYAYATFNNIPTEEDLDVVEEAINEITREKIGVEVTLRPIAISDYSSKVSLSLQGGEKIDVYQSLGDFNNYVSTDMALDLTDMIDEYASGTKEIVGEEWLQACSTDGKIYGIPTMKPVALTPMLIYRQDIADELQIDMSAVNSIEDVTAVLEQVKAAYPDMIPLTAVQTGEIMQDAATTTSAAAETMSSGNYFGYIAAYSYPEADTAASLEAQCGGYDLGAKIIGDAYLSTGDINSVSWLIASTTDVPEAALKFLDLTYTDEDIINLLIYGIEGRDYVKNDDGTVAYPEGEDASTVPYTAQLSCGTLGNYFKMYPLVGTDPASLDWELEQNQTAATSPAMGFTFDSSSVKSQYTAVKNVISQYLPGLICGSLDPDTEIDKFVQALNDAGYQDILDAKQEQLDAWAEAN